MKIGKVTGNVVSSQKDAAFEGVKLLLVQPVDENYDEYGDPLIACDVVQAGVGDYVLFEGGREAALAMEDWFNPSDAAVMAIIDHMEVE